MIKVPLGILAALLLGYVAFYLLPGWLSANEAIEIREDCEAAVLEYAERKASGDATAEFPSECPQPRNGASQG